MVECNFYEYRWYQNIHCVYGCVCVMAKQIFDTKLWLSIHSHMTSLWESRHGATKSMIDKVCVDHVTP